MEESNGNFDFCFQKENKWKLHGETIGKVIAYLTTENYQKNNKPRHMEMKLSVQTFFHFRQAKGP